VYVGPTAFEQRGFELPFQGLDLQGYGGLAQEQLLRRPGNRPVLRGVTKSPQLLEPVLLVVDGCHSVFSLDYLLLVL